MPANGRWDLIRRLKVKLNKAASCVIGNRKLSRALVYLSNVVIPLCLNNHEVPAKTQHIISIMLYSDMFRLEGVIIRLLLKPYLRCTK